MPVKILAFLQAVDLMSPYYLSAINRYTSVSLADTNVLNAFSNTILYFIGAWSVNVTYSVTAIFFMTPA